MSETSRISDIKKPTIAIVIPNKNDSQFLSDCLTSVIRQTVQPDEIIFVDDYSSDNSVEIARLLLRGIRGATIITNSLCRGTMGALNQGLEHASCDYIMFLSSNDYIFDNIVEEAKNSIARNGSPGIWSALICVADETARVKSVYPSPVVSIREQFFSPNDCNNLALKVGNWLNGTTMIYQREALKAINGFNTNYQGLADFLSGLTVASLRGAVFFPRPLGIMRVHAGGVLWRTLNNSKNLDRILDEVELNRYNYAPKLFTNEFTRRMRRRIYFSAFKKTGLVPNIDSQQTLFNKGVRLMKSFAILLGHRNLLSLIFAFFLLVPFDLWSVIRYRIIGWILLKNSNQIAKK